MNELLPRPDEVEYARTISYDGVIIPTDVGVGATHAKDDTHDAPMPEQPSQPPTLSSGVGGATYKELKRRLAKIEASHAELKEAFQTSHLELKAGQSLIMDQLQSLMSMVDSRLPTHRAPSTSAATSPQPPPMDEDGDIFPDGYDLYDDAPSTPADAPITSIGDSKSQGDVLQKGKRKRNPPTRFKDYTVEKKKQRSSTTFDPLAPPDDRLLATFRRWCSGLVPNHRLRDLHTGDYGPSFFWKLMSPQEWLSNDVSKLIYIINNVMHYTFFC